MFITMYGESLVRILEAYGGSPRHVLVSALEKLVLSAVENSKQEVRNEIARTVCEGIHDGIPSSGLKCLTCYQTELNFTGAQAVEAEIRAARAKKEAGGSDE